MVSKQVIIITGILLIAVLGFLHFSNITGNVVTGSAIKQEINEEYFRIDNFGSQINVEVKSNDTQNNSEPR